MLALAVIPGILLLIIVWKFDSVEKEPPQLLFKLFAFGALTVVSAILLRIGGLRVFRSLFDNTSSLWFMLLDCFLLTALVQEGGKLLVLKLITWKNKEFNYTFDAVVYSVCVSLGFAILLNILYCIKFGMNGTLIRALFSVPGHAMNAVFMGYFYGLARYAKGAGDEKAERTHMLEALIVPLVMHGFFDLCTSADRPVFYILFVIYEIIIIASAVKQFLKLSKNDTVIPGMEYTLSDAWDNEEVAK